MEHRHYHFQWLDTRTYKLYTYLYTELQVLVISFLKQIIKKLIGGERVRLYTFPQHPINPINLRYLIVFIDF